MSDFNDQLGAVVSNFSAIDADIKRIAMKLCGPATNSAAQCCKADIRAIQSRYGNCRSAVEDLIDQLERETRALEAEPAAMRLPCQVRPQRFWNFVRGRGRGAGSLTNGAGHALELLFQQSDRIAVLLSRLDKRLEETLAMLQCCAEDAEGAVPDDVDMAGHRSLLFGVLSDAQAAQARIAARLRDDNRVRVALYDELTLSLRDGLHVAPPRSA
ncbi:hypothetical protein [Profundibacterium mesophilum]|uniref:Uncharacterized protein n=1 Tax=Profundibacterium mesophilum KAUST100406-0324 TaxID=1037889 RepID=A0A921NPE9_9RHOB|nr:hypothetical protein [Profundibacterium mesophilum]KAF0674555.1 hypothetical protein PMES_03140 [Profundibacterium mesophilum KAUST100406-0324]